jgi:hypothetical protein
MREGGMVIVTNKVIRDPRTERRIIEYNREVLILGIILAGAVLTIIALVI